MAVGSHSRCSTRTQARLQHPHILPLFDSGVAAGQLYYTMPHVERGSLGDRLRDTGPLDPTSVVQLATEVASALGYAHALGVIHRDLKPENIMFTAMGHAVLAEFGIAWALEDDGDDDRLPSGARLTETSVTMGTPAYMIPEHAAGEAVDARSDQYSLAAVVYEALTGRPPFTGPASRPELSSALEEVVLRGLARQPADRYETVEAFAAALARAQSAPPALAHRPFPRRRAVPAAIALVALGLGVALVGRRWYRAGATDLPVSDDRVVAVLPFKNLGAAEDQYFADGLTEEITSRLASLAGLRVISRTSADQYRGSGKTLRAIGAELGAGYLLEGSVRWERGARGPGRVRVTPQLIRVADDSHLWAESYDAELTEVFRIQSSIAQQVTTALDVALAAPEEALATVETRSAQAYDYYLRGNDYV
ncbi:MAG: protein kinase domain-containing protein, partial [Gemmatimonadales bacterium]